MKKHIVSNVDPDMYNEDYNYCDISEPKRKKGCRENISSKVREGTLSESICFIQYNYYSLIMPSSHNSQTKSTSVVSKSSLVFFQA